MRLVAALVVVAYPALANAEGAAFELGLVHSRVAVTEQTALDATSVRFAIRFEPASMRYLHFGAEAEEGALRGTTSLPNGVVARTATPGGGSPLEGNTLSLRVFAGVHNEAGRLRLGADLAAGMRDTWVSSDAGRDVAGRKNEPLVEARTRIDVRVTPRALIGASVSTDLIEHRDVSVALLFALDFTR